MNRRNFLSAVGVASAMGGAAQGQIVERPNILWITCEDMSPSLGCFGDKYAETPRLDALAEKSLRYTCCWSNAPVCAPARTTIISGVYPPALGAEHMRSMTKMGQGQKMFPQYLREAGYYTTNNSKEDYNIALTGAVWDESSNKAHWRKRKPGQPFFSVFNFVITHESQIRTRPHQQRHDPAEIRVPAYHPDTPEVRRDWAQYYDNVNTMDGMAGKVLDELKADGLDENTIVFFYSDHGSGMPRSKRWPYNSGLRVPLIVHIPEKWKSLATTEYKAGGTTDRPVSFVDLAPTMLSLVGLPKAEYHQGFPFLGKSAAGRQAYVYGFRGRMDERYDMVRSVTDGRYVYLRHYMPHRIYGQHLAYMFETPTTQVWQKMFKEGKLTPAQEQFWKTKPAEALYDLRADRDEVNNVAGLPEYGPILEKLRAAQEALAARIKDIGFLPENEIHERAGSGAPYDAGQKMTNLPKIQAMAGRAASMASRDEGALLAGLKDADSAVRYWAVMGFLMRKKAEPVKGMLDDPAPAVRIVAAETVGRFGKAEELPKVLEVLLELADMEKHGVFLSLQALSALDYLDGKAAPVKAKLMALPQKKKGLEARLSTYVPRLLEDTVKDLP
jgi:arylsulfatase A-like enzyme